MARASFDDDDYGGAGPRTMVRSAYPSPTTAVKWLLIANFAIFLVCFALPDATYAAVVHSIGVDVPSWRAGGPLLPVWQLFTYGFLHSTATWTHIGFNMLTLYFFGVMLEQELGPRRFLITYFAAQVLGGLLFLGVALVGDGEAVLLGASGACFGVMVAAATLWPRRPVIFIIVPLTLRTLALIFVGIEVFALLLSLKGAPSDGVAHITHLGGVLYGFLAVRLGWIRWDPVRALAERRVTRAVEDAAKDEQRMDELLAKIHREGMASLSRGEREFLKRVSSRR